MLHIINSQNIHAFREEMDQAFRLRHRVFVEEKGWSDLSRDDGRETDQFDTSDAVHMVFVDQGEVLGYQRMLPSTKPHLLSEVLPQLCESKPPIGSNIWEWTRYCVEPSYREHGRSLSAVSNALLSGFVEWGLQNGIDTVIIEMQPLWILRLLQLHFRISALGLPQQIAGEDVVAVTAAFDDRTLAKLRSLKTDLRRRAA